MTSRWKNADEFEIKNAENNTLITNFLLFSALPSAPMSLWPLSYSLFLQKFLLSWFSPDLFHLPHLSFSDVSSFCPVLHLFLFWFVLLFLFWFLVLPCMSCCHEFRNSVISFFGSYKSLSVFFFLILQLLLFLALLQVFHWETFLLGRSQSSVLYFILCFSSSPYCTWKGSGTWNTSQEYHGVQSVNIWDNVTPMALGSDQC